MAPVTFQVLTLSFDVDQGGAGAPVQVECQLTDAMLTPNYSDDTLETMCGTFTTTTETWELQIAGLQDWAATDSISDLLWAATEAGSDIDFSLVIGTVTFSGACAPRRTPAGGEAQSPFDFDITLPVQGVPTKVAA